MGLTVYLAGQIHDDWRDEIRAEAERQGLPITFVGPQDDHATSDDIGEAILGEQPNARWKDETASQVNNLRTRVLMAKADVVVALFGEKYRQWNTAMDAATGIAAGKPVILIRDPKLHHALKELSQRAQLVVETPAQAVQALAYILG
jgi:YtoQ family protein